MTVIISSSLSAFDVTISFAFLKLLTIKASAVIKRHNNNLYNSDLSYTFTVVQK